MTLPLAPAEPATPPAPAAPPVPAEPLPPVDVAPIAAVPIDAVPVDASRAFRPAAVHRPYRDRWTLPLLLLLTILAGVLRFTALDRPGIWGDEAATYGRVSGSYEELLTQLADSSFPPLHYQVEWWIGQGMPYWGHVETPTDERQPRTFTPTRFLVPGGIPLSPFVLRFIPALAGTLFVPAIYFLAVQLFGRRVALTAAMLACFSAYNLVYSRDAKMYMHFWLAVTLHVGCALWWVRTRRPLAWACWLLTGVAAVGLHGSGFAILAIDALVVFTSPRQHWRHLYTLPALAVWAIAWWPARFVQRFRGERRWASWVNADAVAVWRHRHWRRLQWPVVIGFAAGVAMMLAAALGPLGYYSSFSRQVARATEDAREQINLNELGIGWVGNYNRGRQLPDFLLYTASAYLTGWEWPRHFPAIGIDDQANVHPRTLRLLQGATVALLTLLAVGLVPWRRAFSPVRARLDRIRQDRCVAPPFRSRRGLWIAVWLTAVPWVTYTQSVAQPANALDAAAGLVLSTPPSVNWPRAKAHPEIAPATQRSAADDWPATWGEAAVDPVLDARDKVAAGWAATRRAAAEVTVAWPAAWKAYSAAFNRSNLSVWKITLLGVAAAALAAMTVHARRRVGRGAVRLAVIAVVLVVVGAVVNVLPRRVDDIIWMPRYLGTILPAVWLLTAVLIDRQPRRLRWATLGLFVAVNMAQFGSRVWGNSEPPNDLIAADVVAAQPKAVIASHAEKPTFRAYVEFGGFVNPEPGGSTLFTPAGCYYLRELSGIRGNTFQVRQNAFFQNLRISRMTVPAAIERDLNRAPEVDRFVVWTGLPTGKIDQADAIADQLKGRFKRVGEELWQARDHWRWYERFQVRRRTYVRVAEPATQPATRPTTQSVMQPAMRAK